jgi:hypothetical protein
MGVLKKSYKKVGYWDKNREFGHNARSATTRFRLADQLREHSKTENQKKKNTGRN